MMLVLALTGLMIAISPIATLAIADHAACAPKPSPAAVAAEMHGHHGHHAPPPPAAADEADSASFSLPPCCDHGCVFGVTLLPSTQTAQAQVSAVPSDWSSADLADLTDPNGLRRPPRA